MKDDLKILILIMKSVHHQRHRFHELVMTNKHDTQAVQSECSAAIYIKAHFNMFGTVSYRKNKHFF